MAGRNLLADLAPAIQASGQTWAQVPMLREKRQQDLADRADAKLQQGLLQRLQEKRIEQIDAEMQQAQHQQQMQMLPYIFKMLQGDLGGGQQQLTPEQQLARDKFDFEKQKWNWEKKNPKDGGMTDAERRQRAKDYRDTEQTRLTDSILSSLAPNIEEDQYANAVKAPTPDFLGMLAQKTETGGHWYGGGTPILQSDPQLGPRLDSLAAIRGASVEDIMGGRPYGLLGGGQNQTNIGQLDDITAKARKLDAMSPEERAKALDAMTEQDRKKLLEWVSAQKK